MSLQSHLFLHYDSLFDIIYYGAFRENRVREKKNNTSIP